MGKKKPSWDRPHEDACGLRKHFPLPGENMCSFMTIPRRHYVAKEIEENCAVPVSVPSVNAFMFATRVNK